MKLRPLHDKIIVKQRDAEEISEGGILIVGTQEKPRKGDVLAVGPGRYLETGDFVDTKVQVGDVVLFGGRAGEEVQIDEKTTLLVLREPEILAIVDE
jgi:chaperonin GroES